MANELNWLRANAKRYESETMTIVPSEAAEVGIVAGEYAVERFSFRGIIPFRMARALSGAKLTNTDMEFESLRLGTGYRGGEGVCEYYRTTYALREAV